MDFAGNKMAKAGQTLHMGDDVPVQVRAALHFDTDGNPKIKPNVTTVLSAYDDTLSVGIVRLVPSRVGNMFMFKEDGEYKLFGYDATIGDVMQYLEQFYKKEN